MASEQNTKKEGKALNKMMGILRCPKITEKAAALAESNFYVFDEKFDNFWEFFYRFGYRSKLFFVSNFI